MAHSKEFNKQFCQTFQTQLSYDKIDSIWKNFRQAGNSIEGRITKLNFKKVMGKFGTTNQTFLDRLFDRFYLNKNSEKSQKEEIELQDFVLGLTVLSRLVFIEKIRVVFYLTDLDEDGCLSLEQIQNMIQRIQRIFCKQNSTARVQSYNLLFELAHKKAQRNYHQVLNLLSRNNKELKHDQGGLITCDQFMDSLQMSYDLCKQQKFIPLNLSLFQIIDNVVSQPTIRISQSNKKTFIQFRQQLCGILQQGKGQKQQAVIKYPGKVQIVKDGRVVQNLANSEKQVDKKPAKNATKKINLGGGRGINDLKQQGKNAQQSLQTYKMKVLRMIETKQDPRLNVHFDQMFRKK